MSAVRPALSVVIAAFDAETTLGAQLDALAAQRPNWPWEILVCDNGSSDGTRDLVERRRREMPELRLVDASARRGPAAARNIGVQHSSGTSVAFCDADDIVGEGWVDAVHRALETHAVVAGPFEVSRLAGGSPFQVTWSPQLDGLTRSGVLDGFVTAGAGNLAVHRTVFESAGGFDETFTTAEDDDFCLRIQVAGHRFFYEPSMLLHVRRRGGLRQVARQARAYGAGHRLLEHRWARVAASRRPTTVGTGAEAPPVPSSQRTLGSRIVVLGRAVRLATRLWRPGKLADAVWKVSWTVGYRVTDPDGTDQLSPPAVSRSA